MLQCRGHLPLHTCTVLHSQAMNTLQVLEEILQRPCMEPCPLNISIALVKNVCGPTGSPM